MTMPRRAPHYFDDRTRAPARVRLRVCRLDGRLHCPAPSMAASLPAKPDALKCV